MFVIRSLGTFQTLEDIGKVRVGFHDGVPVQGQRRRHGHDGLRAAPGRRHARRQRGRRRGHRAHAPRREPVGRARGAARARRRAQRARSCPTASRSTPFYDRTDLVDTTLDTVFHNLAEGAMLVTLVLFVVPAVGARVARSSRAVIPLSLAASFIYLHARGMSANLLSMGAVDFGIIVDGAVILVEHVFATAPATRTSDRRRPSAIERDLRGRARGRAADAVLAAHHHRRVPADLLAPARRGPHLRADGAHRGERAASARCS